MPIDKALSRLRAARGFVFDMDGTLVLGDRSNSGFQPLPGAVELLTHLHEKGIPFAVLTNGTVRTPDEYVVKLRSAGFPLADRMALTPSSVAADYLVEKGFRRVLVLGAEGVWRPLEAAGIEVVRGAAAENVDAVFVGWYREFHMDEIQAAVRAVENGARLFAGSLAPYFASSHGKVLSSSRVICAAITSVTGKRPTVLGKPAPAAFAHTCARLGARPKDVVVVGDDPSLEVFMARRNGALGVAVRTGVWGNGDVKKLPAQHRPHFALQNVGELFDLLKGSK